MNIGDITVIISVLAGMIAIPFAASSVTVADDYKYGLATILNSTPDFAANSSSSIPTLISKTVSDEGIKYIYRTPYGEFSILISPEKFEETLLKAGKKVSSLQSSSEQVWELSMPSESLIINHNNQKIIETYRNLDGYLRITKENGWTSQDKSGTATEEELLAGMLRLESELNETISLMKNMSEKILNANASTPVIQSQSVVINEFESNPAGDDTNNEWVELYNPTTEDINMTGWKIYNKNINSRDIPYNTTIKANSYYVLNITGDFITNDVGDQLTLKNDTVIIDVTSLKSDTANNDKCWARVPNGIDTGSDSDWTFQLCTKSSSNDG